MRQILPDVYILEGLRIGNVYLLTSEHGLTLVDSGMAGAADGILAQIHELGYAPSDVHSIVLTHYHADHAGNAALLAGRCGAQVLAHHAEVPVIEQTRQPSAGPFVPRVVNWLSYTLGLFKAPPCKVTRTVEDGDLIEALGGLQVVHTPGHTAGSICLYQPGRQMLLCGDALFNVNMVTRRAGLQFPSRLVSADMAQVRASVRRLTALPVEVLLFGHGEPILAGAVTQIKALLEQRWS